MLTSTSALHYIIESDLDEGYKLLHCLSSLRIRSRYQLTWILDFCSLLCHADCLCLFVCCFIECHCEIRKKREKGIFLFLKNVIGNILHNSIIIAEWRRFLRFKSIWLTLRMKIKVKFVRNEYLNPKFSRIKQYWEFQRYHWHQIMLSRTFCFKASKIDN